MELVEQVAIALAVVTRARFPSLYKLGDPLRHGRLLEATPKAPAKPNPEGPGHLNFLKELVPFVHHLTDGVLAGVSVDLLHPLISYLL
jgi:hypothetical protein